METLTVIELNLQRLLNKVSNVWYSTSVPGAAITVLCQKH